MGSVRIQADADVRNQLRLQDTCDASEVDQVIQKANSSGQFTAEKSADGQTLTVKRK